MPIKISELLPKKSTIDTGNGSLEVGPLNLAAMTRLIQQYKDAIIALIESGISGTPNFALAVETAPGLILSMIALGADAEGQEDDIAQLPVGVQIMAAAEIWTLSVPDVKKLVAVLSAVLGQVKQELPLRPPPATVALPSTD